MFEIIFAGQTCKDSTYPESIEDSVLFGIDKSLIVIGDGASESYDSKTWVDLLVKKFSEDSHINEVWLDSVRADYLSKYEISSLSWSKLSAFERGSFAALLGIKEVKPRLIEINAIGDCQLFVINSEEKIKFCYPYIYSAEFSDRPKLLSTKFDLNTDLKDFKPELRPLDYGDRILMMSDALGCWFLQSYELSDDSWKQILDIKTHEDLLILIDTLRINRKIKVDDVTLVIAQSVDN